MTLQQIGQSCSRLSRACHEAHHPHCAGHCIVGPRTRRRRQLNPSQIGTLPRHIQLSIELQAANPGRSGDDVLVHASPYRSLLQNIQSFPQSGKGPSRNTGLLMESPYRKTSPVVALFFINIQFLSRAALLVETAIRTVIIPAL